MQTAKIGIIGTGHISDIYLKNLNTVYPNTQVVACADVNLAAAQAKADKWSVPDVLDVDTLLSREDISIVVNLTPPQHHYSVIRQALLAGKHVYTEKPLAASTEQANALVALAEEKGLLLCSAPETNYGATVSTAKALLQEDAIGKILYADARFRWPGDENWHPNPAFLYQKGAGPLYDRGPYFLNVLVDLLGKVDSVFAMGAIGYPTRTVTSKPRFGEVFPVETFSHMQGMLRFSSGVLASTLFSFDLKCPYDSAIELFGTKGSMRINEPIGFGAPLELSIAGEDYQSVPLVNDRTDNIRGYAVSCMAAYLNGDTNEIPAPGSRARHLVEIMDKYMESAQQGVLCPVDSTP